MRQTILNKAFLLGAALTSLLASCLCILYQGDGGLSFYEKLALAGFFTVGTLFLHSFFSISDTGLADKLVGSFLEKKRMLFPLASALLLITLVFASLPGADFGGLSAYRDKLMPAAIWVILILLQFLIIAGLWRADGIRFSTDIKPAVYIFTFLALFFGFILLTRLGIEPKRGYWQDLGTPLMLHQVVLAFAACLSVLYILKRLRGAVPVKIESILIPSLLWLAAFVYWNWLPLPPGHFAPKPVAPDFQYYPFSDAELYDLAAHVFLLGNGMPADTVVNKPLYSFFLALGHLLFNENYAGLISFQVFILAGIPALVYLAISELAGRFAGLLSAFLVLLREANSISLTNVIQVSHSKLLLTDVPAMAFAALLLYLSILWLKRRPQGAAWPLGIGALIGCFALMRSQALIFLPFLVVYLFLQYAANRKAAWMQSILLIVGAVVFLLPQMYRNYSLSGKFSVNYSPRYSYMLTGQFSRDGVTLPRLPDESDETYIKRANQKVVNFILSDSLYVLDFIAGHFLHNQIQSVLFLPGALNADDMSAYVKVFPFWKNWDGTMPTISLVFIFINLALISIGAVFMWKQHGWLAFLPAIFFVAYLAGLSLFGYSGWRFLLPVDWIIITYYSTGITAASSALYGLIQGARTDTPAETSPADVRFRPAFSFRTVFQILPLILMAGSILPLSERIIPKRFENQDPALLISLMNLAPAEKATVQNFISLPQAFIGRGLAIYPRFFKPGAGLSNPPYLPVEYDRLSFQLISTAAQGVVFPASFPPDGFHGGDDVIVLGCRNGAVIEAVLIYSVDKHTIHGSFDSLTSCQ